MADFKGIYYDTRCLLQHRDPYKESEPLRVYQEEEGWSSLDVYELQQILMLDVYLPTAYVFIAPFAMLPWGPASLLWIIVTAGSLALASFLMWDVSANHALVVSGGLICFLLANSEIMFGTGNPAGIVVSLCVVAVWCFLNDWFVPAGILCLAISLTIKPHDAGLVWLYFLLAGGVYRKHALQTLALTVALSLPTILWVTHAAPNWMQELHSNLVAASAPGWLSDPRLDSITGNTCSMVIDLQSALSVFWNDPRIYNLLTGLICGTLLLVWLVRTLRLRLSPERAWLALASIAPLTILVNYHRPYDAKLLLLTIPACAILWAEGGFMKWIALVMSASGIVLTGDIPLAMLQIFTRNLHLSTAELSGEMLTVVLRRPMPLILLAMAIFYLWVYVRRTAPDAKSGSAQSIPVRSESTLKAD
jgi:hypothetical protein